MIISCTCGARLKIGDEKLTDAGVKIRCPKCSTIHLVRKPRTEKADAQAVVPARPAVPPAPEPAMPWFAPSAAVSPTLKARGTLVLVAHDSKVVADMIDGVLRQAGMSTEHAANGLEALRMATDLKPEAMVVDVGLTGIYGFELCERLKGDPDTNGIKIVLLSSVYGLTAYKRSPMSLYGADDYIEKHHIPDTLVPKLRRLMSAGQGPASAAPNDGGALSSLAGGTATAQAVQSRAGKEAPVSPQPLEVSDIPSILPKTPVTLTTFRKRKEPVTSSGKAGARAPSAEEPKGEALADPASSEAKRREQALSMTPQTSSVPYSETPAARALTGVSAPAEAPANASPKLGAAFFEHEEYVAPAGAGTETAVDPAEIEKAKRFARIIVSDIVLYNQESVAEGLIQGTFYDLLKDDIAEGRAVYAQRVPETVRRRHDYLQEAFDDFIASKKKGR